MPWGKMDDKFHRNAKVRALRRMKGGREALGSWVYWWSWCLDDPGLSGFVPTEELPAADLKSAELLVQVGLWERVSDGFLFHDFDKYNPSRKQVDTKRMADRERIAAKRTASRENVASDIDATSSPVACESPPCARAGIPSRPVPSEEAAAAASGDLDVALEPHDVSRAWHRALTQPGGGDLLTMHALTSWQDEYATIATVLNRLPQRARWVALDAVCQWFWLAQDGPVQSGRLERVNANPGHLAKRISTDLRKANEWFATQPEARAS